MGMPPPLMAVKETILTRYIKKFHDSLVDRLAVSAKDTLRATAWQVDQYMDENKKFKDAEFLRGVLATLEYVIQQKYGGKWTVERAKRDMRGRTIGVNQHADKRKHERPRRRVPISRDLARALSDVTAKTKPNAEE